MKHPHLKLLLLSAFVLQAGQGQLASADEQVTHNLSEAQKLAREFNARLRAKLQLAIAEEGPLAAIKVCATHAPGIAERLQEQHITVKRTSERLRNPENAPDIWEQRILTFFEQERQAGADPANLEHYAQFIDEQGTLFRYARAIPTGAECLMCHGDNLAPDIAAELARLYPDDKATGFNTGDIRGLVSISIREPN
jgi:hypothetical protein